MPIINVFEFEHNYYYVSQFYLLHRIHNSFNMVPLPCMVIRIHTISSLAEIKIGGTERHYSLCTCTKNIHCYCIKKNSNSCLYSQGITGNSLRVQCW